MGILIDKREKQKFRDVLRVKGLDFEEAVVETGDVICWNDENPDIKIVIERKRIDDLVSSYHSKRLGTQFERLSREKFAVLIITGSMKEVNRKYLPFNVIPQFVETVMSLAIVKYNFRSVIWLVEEFNDAHHVGFVTMIKGIQRIVEGQLDVIPEKNIKSAKDPRVTALLNLFGISPAICKNLLKKYGTVRKVLELTDNQLIKIDGLGPAKVKSIRNILDKNINTKKVVVPVKVEKPIKINLKKIIKSASSSSIFCNTCGRNLINSECSVCDGSL